MLLPLGVPLWDLVIVAFQYTYAIDKELGPVVIQMLRISNHLKVAPRSQYFRKSLQLLDGQLIDLRLDTCQEVRTVRTSILMLKNTCSEWAALSL
jgi:hypothetical protein